MKIRIFIFLSLVSFDIYSSQQTSEPRKPAIAISFPGTAAGQLPTAPFKFDADLKEASATLASALKEAKGDFKVNVSTDLREVAQAIKDVTIHTDLKEVAAAIKNVTISVPDLEKLRGHIKTDPVVLRFDMTPEVGHIVDSVCSKCISTTGLVATAVVVEPGIMKCCLMGTLIPLIAFPSSVFRTISQRVLHQLNRCRSRDHQKL